MTLKIADRIKETTSSTGTADFALAGAIAGYKAFSSKLSVGDTTWYCANAGSDWEVGIGTFATGDVLQRTTVLDSSNAGAAVNFAASPQVFCTIPAEKVPSVGPGFSATMSANQSISAATDTKVNFDTVEWDFTGAYSTSNKRFQPAVAGYYLVNVMVSSTGHFGSNSFASIFKNGVESRRGTQLDTANLIFSMGVTGLVYLNGTTDYIEAHVYSTGAAATAQAGAAISYFQASLVRPG